MTNLPDKDLPNKVPEDLTWLFVTCDRDGKFSLKKKPKEYDLKYFKLAVELGEAALLGDIKKLAELYEKYNLQNINTAEIDSDNMQQILIRTLNKAAEKGQVAFIRELIKRTKLDVNKNYIFGGTALHHAILNKQHQAMRCLVEEFGADPLAVNLDKNSCFLAAIKADNTDALKYLLQRGIKLSQEHKSILREAAQQSDESAEKHGSLMEVILKEKVADELLKLLEQEESRPEISYRRELPNTLKSSDDQEYAHLLEFARHPLTVALINQNHRAARLLVEKYVLWKNVNRIYQAIIEASTIENHKMLSELVEIGTNLGIKPSQYPIQGYPTPAMMAAYRGAKNNLITLLKIDPLAFIAKDSQGNTPLHYASMFRIPVMMRTDSEEYLAIKKGIEECARVLLEKGSPVDAKNYSLETPLFIASRMCKIDLVRILIEEGGANVHEKDKDKRTSISQAILNSYASTSMNGFEVFQYLVETAKADIMEIDSRGRSNLLYLADTAERCNGKPDCSKIVLYLLNKGAVFNIESDPTDSPIIFHTPKLFYAKQLFIEQDTTKVLKLIQELKHGINGREMVHHNTALHHSIASENMPKSLALLAAPGIDIYMPNKKGQTPFDIAMAMENKPLLKVAFLARMIQDWPRRGSIVPTPKLKEDPEGLRSTIKLATRLLEKLQGEDRYLAALRIATAIAEQRFTTLPEVAHSLCTMVNQLSTDSAKKELANGLLYQLRIGHIVQSKQQNVEADKKQRLENMEHALEHLVHAGQEFASHEPLGLLATRVITGCPDGLDSLASDLHVDHKGFLALAKLCRDRYNASRRHELESQDLNLQLGTALSKVEELESRTKSNAESLAAQVKELQLLKATLAKSNQENPKVNPNENPKTEDKSKSRNNSNGRIQQ